MKTTSFLNIMLVAITLNVSAQSFKKKQVDINIGLSPLNNWGFLVGATQGFPMALNTSAEVGISDHVGIGFSFGYLKTTSENILTETYTNANNELITREYKETYKNTQYLPSIRFSYHLNNLLFDKLIKNEAILKEKDNIDVYAGGSIGILYTNYSSTSTRVTPSDRIASFNGINGASIGGFVGGRYRFNKHLGVFAEFGFRNSYATAGLNIKL